MREDGRVGGRAQNDDPIVLEIRYLANRAAAELSAAGARDEALATFQPSRRVMLIKRAPVMVPMGRVWRLGVILLDADARLYATGLTTRVLEPGRPGFQSLSAETRRMYRGAAFRGPFERGETVNFDARPIPVQGDELRGSSGPLFIRGSRALVRWNTSAGDDAAVGLEAYLAERVGLLISPPEGT